MQPADLTAEHVNQHSDQDVHWWIRKGIGGTMPGFERVPIIALTANVMRGDKEKTLEAGCDGYIQKPLDIDQLLREVARFLSRRNNG